MATVVEESASLAKELFVVQPLSSRCRAEFQAALTCDCPDGPMANFGLDGDWTGQAWAILWKSSQGRIYALVGSMIATIAVLRPSAKLDIGDGLDAYWPTPETTDTSETERLADALRPACHDCGYTL